MKKLTEKEILFVDDWTYLNDSECGFKHREKLYCCESMGLPLRSNSVQLPEPGDCGIEGTTNKILGGEVTSIDDYPWMALLKYSKRVYLFFS